MQRRDFLQMMALAAPALLPVDGCSLLARPPRFLCLSAGGYIAQRVIPYSSSYYYETRPQHSRREANGADATDGGR